MWFEERSWSNLRVSELVEEWRDLWPHKLEFMVAVISYVFATTNFLNLPRLILDNGGVAFVAAYGSVLLTLVLPVVVLELAIGQLTGRAPVAAFDNLSPAFKGIGVSQILFTMLVLACMTRFLAILGLYAYNLFFTLYQGRTGLPWLNCQGFPEIISQPCREAGSLANFTSGASTKMSAIRGESTLMQFMAHYENPSQSIDDFGEFQYWLLGAQGIIWGLVFLSVFYGVRWVGKVISFNMLFAFCFFVGLVVRALTLGGLMDILDVYWKATDWNKLADYQVWKIAVEQAILASGIGFGALITIGSYNKRHNNLVCDSILIVFFHAIFTIMQVAFVIGIVGYVSMKTGLQPGELLEKGEAQMWHIFAYLSYVPQTKLITGAVLIASILILLNIFYLLTLSLLSTMEDALGDRWSRCCYRFILAFFLCGLMMAMSLYFATQAGRHAYDLVTGFLKYITIFVILTFELFAAAWFYCAWTLGTDLRTMLRNACSKCLGQTILLLTYLLPFVPAVVAVLNAMSYDFASFSPAIHHWEWSEYVGAACAVVPLLPIPLYFLATLTKACCCRDKHGHSRGQRIKLAVSSRLRRDKEKAAPPPRYTGSAPGYLLLPQAPLAEPETYA